MNQDQEELLLVVGILGIIGAMVAGIFWWQRRMTAQLQLQETITLSIDSVGRGVAVILPAAMVFPVGVGVVGHLTDPWMRSHALGAVLISVIGGVLAVPAALWATARFRSIGSLTLSPTELRLQAQGRPDVAVDLTKPFRVDECWTTGAESVPIQIVVVRGEQTIAFGYSLGIRGEPRGGPVQQPIWPSFGLEAKVLHERLTQRKTL